MKKSLFTPILALKLRYVPLLLIYFAYGMQGITGVALVFWEKEFLDLSAENLVTIGIWISLPFTIKMVFGQLVDVVSLFGSRRKVWICVGAATMAVGYLTLYAMAVNSPYVDGLGGQYSIYLISQLLMVLGFVIQDVTADAMTAEVVDRSQADEVVRKELAMVQVLGRLAMMSAFAIFGGVGGYLAETFTYESVFLLALIIPLVSTTGALFIRLEKNQTTQQRLNPLIFGGGLVFAVFSVFMGYNDFPFSQEITFVVSFLLLSFMLSSLFKGQDRDVVKVIVMTLIAIFLFRMAPSAGPGYSWWAIDALGFDPTFFGTLRTVGSLAALIVLWFISDFISSKSIRSTYLVLIIILTILRLPDLFLYNGLHELLGINARTIALLDTMSESPMAQISMIPALALIAYYAPSGKSATWFAVAASFMNLASIAGGLLTKYLNKIFIVTREIKDKEGVITTAADYSQLGHLLWVSLIISFIVPMVGVLFFLKKKDPTKK